MEIEMGLSYKLTAYKLCLCCDASYLVSLGIEWRLLTDGSQQPKNLADGLRSHGVMGIGLYIVGTHSTTLLF